MNFSQFLSFFLIVILSVGVHSSLAIPRGISLKRRSMTHLPGVYSPEDIHQKPFPNHHSTNVNNIRNVADDTSKITYNIRSESKNVGGTSIDEIGERLTSHIARLHGRSSGFAIKMNGGWQVLGAYFLDVTVSGKTFNVLVDTGSSNLVIPYAPFEKDTNTNGDDPMPVSCESSECKVCNVSPGCSECAFEQPFCAANGACGAGITYGGGSSSVMGFLARGRLCEFGPTCVNNTFTAVTDNQPVPLVAAMEKAGIKKAEGGLIGLAYEFNSCNPVCIKTVFSEIVDRSGISNEFAMCLTANNGGRIDMGYVDGTTGASPMEYTPITREHWYNIDISSIGAGSYVAENIPWILFRKQNDLIGSFVDSGTSVVLMGPQIFQGLKTLLKDKYCDSVSGLCEIFENNCVSASSIDLSKFPPITFTVPKLPSGSMTLSIPATSYVATQGNQACLLVAPTASLGVVLGDTFMQNYYIHFDRKNKRLGFAPLNECST